MEEITTIEQLDALTVADVRVLPAGAALDALVARALGETVVRLVTNPFGFSPAAIVQSSPIPTQGHIYYRPSSHTGHAMHCLESARARKIISGYFLISPLHDPTDDDEALLLFNVTLCTPEFQVLTSDLSLPKAIALALAEWGLVRQAVAHG